MKFKVAIIIFVPLVLSSCATRLGDKQSDSQIPRLESLSTPATTQHDWPTLSYGRTSSRLRIVDDEGNAVRAFNGNYLSIPGYVFVANNISLHPGTHRISYKCPQREDAIQISHYVPSVNFTFEAGKQYELHCVGGQPVINLSKEQEDYSE